MASAAQIGGKAAFLLGRVALGGFFLYSGINHFKSHRQMTQYAGAKGVPLPDVAIPVTGALLVAGGASLMLGLRPKWGALAIIGFLAGVSPTMHNFWKVEDPEQRQNDMINFSKNVALAGAALALLGVEEWPLSVAPGERVSAQITRRVRDLAA